MKKILSGKIVSLKMEGTAIVEVTRRVAHPLYKKLLKRTKRYKADINRLTLTLGDSVRIEAMRPISKGKYFKILEVVKEK